MRISIHTLRMEGDYFHNANRVSTLISIHTLRMEGDRCASTAFFDTLDFNPHPPHGG